MLQCHSTCSTDREIGKQKMLNVVLGRYEVAVRRRLMERKDGMYTVENSRAFVQSSAPRPFNI